MQNFYFLAVSLEKFRFFMIVDLLLPGFQGFSYRRRMLLFVHWIEKPMQTRCDWGGAVLHHGMLPPLPQLGCAPSDPLGT